MHPFDRAVIGYDLQGVEPYQILRHAEKHLATSCVTGVSDWRRHCLYEKRSTNARTSLAVGPLVVAWCSSRNSVQQRTVRVLETA